MKILIVDDNRIYRQAIKEYLEMFLLSEANLITEAQDGEEAIAKAREIKPDVVIMDIGLPGINGLEAARLIKLERPEVQVVIITVRDGGQYKEEAVKLGAASFLTKDRITLDLLPLLNNLLNKQNKCCNDVAQPVTNR